MASEYVKRELARLGVLSRVEKNKQIRADKTKDRNIKKAAALEYRRYILEKKQEARDAARIENLKIPPSYPCDVCGEQILIAPGKVRLPPFCPVCQQIWLKENALEPREVAALARVQGLGATRYGGAYITPLKTGTCIYCGGLADSLDHIIPRAYAAKVNLRRKKSVSPGPQVEACRECNAFLGSTLLFTVSERARYLYGRYKIRRRYSWQRLRHLFIIANSEKL